MFPKKFFGNKKVTNGFTLVEIIVVLVILAILAAATIPSMLGFVKDAKQKSLTSEVRAVYTAAQAYVTEHFVKGDLDIAKIEGEINSNHDLYYLLQNDATGTISDMNIDNGKVKSFSYVKNNIQANYTEQGITFTNPGSSSAPSESTEASAEPSVAVSPSVEISPSPSPSPVVINATFDTGSVVNRKMKVLAGDGSIDSVTAETADNNIQGILKATATQFENANVTKDSAHTLSASGSEEIYAWYANNNIYYYTDADNVFLNADSSYLCRTLVSLTDISGLQSLDTSNVTTLTDAFAACDSLTNLGSLSSCNTGNVTTFAGMFYHCDLLNDISGISNWNVTSAADVNVTFMSCSSLADATCLKNWNPGSKISTFQNTPAAGDVSKLPSWYQ